MAYDPRLEISRPCGWRERHRSLRFDQSGFHSPRAPGIPHPATVIIDKQGVVRFVNVWVNYRERTAPATIIEELKKLK